jgi:putative colanic acid biosynthesis glycosyltransferase WcaI
MRVMVLSEYYEPDLGPDAPLFTMLCENLVQLGHQVTMITAVPHYPSGRVSTEFRGKGKWLWKSVENGVEVVRVSLPSLDRSKFPQRMLQFICYQIGATWASLGKQYDVVISSGPSLEVWLPYAYLVGLRHKPAIYFVLDVYPGVGVTLGIFRRKMVVAMVSKLERFCLDKASAILVLSDSFRLELRTLGVPDEKMILVSIWVDTNLVHPMPRDNNFSRENDLNGKFVVLYAGNLGLSQELGQVLVAAEMLKEYQDVSLVFVGDGANRAQLVAEAEHRQLKNVKFLPYQPRQRLPEVLASADVSLVKLQRGVSLSSVPSKTFSLLASGRPILANVDEKSECWELIKQAKAGLCVPPGDPSALVETILTLKKDRQLCDQMGHNGRTWAENYHSPQAAAKKIEKLLLEITCSNNKRAGR